MNPLQSPTYQKLRDLILASEGRTLEQEIFKDGCLVCSDDEKFLYNTGVWGIGEKFAGRVLFSTDRDVCVRFVKDNPEIFEILGLPISLARVLRALEKKYGHIVTYYLSSKGELGVLEQDDPYHNFRFSLKVDLNAPLHLHTEEVIGKVVEILEGNQK